MNTSDDLHIICAQAALKECLCWFHSLSNFYCGSFMLRSPNFIHCYHWIYYITSTKTTSSSLLIFIWWSCPSAMFLKSKVTTSGSWYLFSLYLICKLPKKGEKVIFLVKIIFKELFIITQNVFCYLINFWSSNWVYPFIIISRSQFWCEIALFS